MNKILEKIYSEKDINTNISIFVGSCIALPIYIKTKDPYLSLVFFVGVFSLTKVFSKILVKKFYEKYEKKLKINSFSEQEKNIINIFVNKGTSFLIYSDIINNQENIFGDAFESLHHRGIIEFVDMGGMGEGPTGFKLSENIYTLFLKK